MNNVREEPLNMGEGSFAGFFRSAASGFRSSRTEGAEEFESNPYVTMADEEAQNEFDRRWQGSTPIQDAFRSASGFLGFQAKEPPPKVGFFEGARQNGLIQTLTPGFLKSDQDEDFASTCCPSLSIQQRIFGCACCFAAGQLLQFFAFGASAGVLVGHPGRFARCYSMGNMMMIAGSFFLSGPKRQCNKIKEKNRLPTFCAFICAMVLTLTVVYSSPFLGRALLILLLVVIQWCAQVWYILSYVPYGHTVGRRVLKTLSSWCCSG
jgi:hypothetical protein